MEIENRNNWIGIIIGACFIAAGPLVGYFRMDVTTYMVIFFLIGGFIAGIFSPGKVRDGIYSGVMSGLIGSGIVAVPIVWTVIISVLRGPLDFVAGFGIFFGLLFAALAVLLASIGAVVGVMVRRRANEK